MLPSILAILGDFPQRLLAGSHCHEEWGWIGKDDT
jgi:hypothetical protein